MSSAFRPGRSMSAALTYLFPHHAFLLSAALFIGRRQFSQKYQLVHVHSVPDFLAFAAIVPKLLERRWCFDIHDVLPEFYASKFHVTMILSCSVAWSSRNDGQSRSPITRLLPIIYGASGWRSVAECRKSVRRSQLSCPRTLHPTSEAEATVNS